MFLFGVNMIRW